MAGYIARALPDARLICLRRDPLDTVWSNYRHLFATGYSYYNYSSYGVLSNDYSPNGNLTASLVSGPAHGTLNFNSDGSITFMFGKFEVEMFEGFGTVLYPPACIGEDFLEYLRIASENADCRLSDDVVLSFYFSSRRIPIYLCNSPSATEPFYPTGSLAYSNEKDALGLQASGHLPRYKRVREFLSTRFPLVSDVFRGRR
jgi:hypothetical protein